MTYLCTMYKKILCMAMAFALNLMAWGEDVKMVIDYYQPEMSKGFIFISKVDMTLTLVDSQGRVVTSYPIACGRNIGQKTMRGDYKTPEGHFLLQNIHDASSWGHDFHDGNGFIRHAYGPYFLRLKTGFQGIGIHGTHAPQSIGTRATEGCIRLDNANVADLEPRVRLGMPVIIGPEAGVASLIASHTPRPARPVLYERPAAKPAEPSLVGSKFPVVDGLVDIDTESDLFEYGLPSVPAVAPRLAGQAADDGAASDAITVAAETPAEAELPAIAPEPVTVEPAVIKSPVVEPVAEAPVTEPVAVETAPVAVPVADEPVGEDAPQYEVVVEEVTQPDGTTKFEVRYKRVN